MDIQLRHVFKILYKGDSPLLNCLAEDHDWFEHSDDPSEQKINRAMSAYINRRQLIRWFIPRLTGVACPAFNEVAMQADSDAHQKPIQPQTHVNFVREHLKPIYSKIDFLFDDKCIQCSDNLQDLMGRKNNKFKACGSKLIDLILEAVMEPNKLQELVYAQLAILLLYNDRPDQFRKEVMRLVDDAIQGENDASIDRQTLILLHQLRTTLLTILSQGHDAIALTCLILYSILHKGFFALLPLFQGKSINDMFQLNNDPEFCDSQQLPGGFVLTDEKRYNYIGGYGSTNVTLWDKDGQMIDKITDVFGYFFYPVKQDDYSHLIYPGAHNSFPLCFETMADGRILCTWIYQQDGRYYEDEDGFGGTDQDEIVLYAAMDFTGRFVTPFSLNVPE